MKRTFLELNCGLCSDKVEIDIKIPEGWNSGFDFNDSIEIDTENETYCPKHAVIRGFTNNQCPGCVEGWGDCQLWKSFAYSELRLNEDDFAMLNNGRCPKRTNGTSSFTLEGNFKSIDISEVNEESIAGGQALAQAIKEYGE